MFTRFLFLFLTRAVALAAQPYAGFEARLTHPIDLTPDGERLLAVHAEASRLSIFDAALTQPALVAQVPTGLEPVSVRARTNDEAWVVCEVSDSIHIVSLSTASVTAVIRTGDEPADVVFADGKAFVTCARDNEIWIYDAATRALLAQVPVQGLYPTALAVSADGSRVFAAFLHSGNGTTILKKQNAPPPPAPTNPALPAAPHTGLIVPASDARIPYTVLDHDVVEIDTATHAIVRYLDGVGTNLFALASRPGHSELWAANTEALNLIQFEPALNARFALNRLGAIDLSAGVVTSHDLNPGIDYDLLPNPAAQATALSQPMALVFESDGQALWTAAFASDRVARVDAATGAVLSRVDVRAGGGDSGVMRGPRGLVMHPASGRLFVLNKLAETLSVIDTQAAEPVVIAEVELSAHDPLPPEVKQGRGFLFDARLSGNGTVSCGICHLDADRDGMAWDLGDPGGEMMTVIGQNLSIHDLTPHPRVMHPMKGPMTTQTLRGMQDGAPFHWRGDRATIADFNPTFPNLMGGEEINEEQMAALTAYLQTLQHHPNPNRNPDRTLPATFDGGNPTTGRTLFINHIKSHCITCHSGLQGSDNNIDLPQEVGSPQPLKNPPLRTLYQRLFYDPRPGATSLSGFGILHDGSGFSLPIGHPYVLDHLNELHELRDVAAFMMCFDTGTAPLVGRTTLVSESNRSQSSILAELTLLETRSLGNDPDCEVVARGLWQGEARSWWFNPATQQYRADRAAGGTLTRAALLAGLQSGDSLSFMGVLPGQGDRLGGDLDGDGVLDGDDPDHRVYNGSPKITGEPADKAVAPGGQFVLNVSALGEPLEYEWYRNNQLLPTQTEAQLQRAGVSTADAGNYHVIVRNGLGQITSRTAKVEVYPAPVITVQPVSRTVDQNKNSSLSVTASGTNLRYQWRRGAQNITGATERVLSFPKAQAEDAATYSVIVFNGAGSVTSDPATLSVTIPPVVVPLDITDATVGQSYHFPLTALNNPTRFTVSGLPRGLSLANGRFITGKAAVSGDFDLRITAHNSAGSSGTAVIMTLKVKAFPDGAIGKFEGVAPRHDTLNNGIGGWLRLTGSRLATFSGSLRLGGKTYPLRNSWKIENDDPPQTTFTINRGKIEVTLTATPSEKKVSVTLKDLETNETIDFDLWRALDSTADEAGSYTLALPAPDHSADAPHGDSVGGFRLTEKGAARGSYWLADGTRLTLASQMLEGGRIRVWHSLYRGTGSLGGFLRVRAGESHRLEGSVLSWFKKAQTRKTRSYPGGFGPLDLAARGGLYPLPARNAPLAGFESAALIFEHGGAPDPATRLNVAELIFPAQHSSRAEITGDNPANVTLTLQTGAGKKFSAGSTGSFTARFTLFDPDTTVTNQPQRKRAVTFRGRVVDDGSGPRGYGFFLLPEMPATGPPLTTLKSSRILSGRARLNPLP